MTRLLMLVEGQSEEVFVKRTLAPHLARHGVYVHPPIVLWTKRLMSGGGFRGGVSNWDQILQNLLPLTHDSDAWVSCLLDFYGLPEDFPGLPETLGVDDPREKVTQLQERFALELKHPRFIPFLALHEFEAWLFSAPDTVEAHFGKAHLAEELRATVRKAGAPELIDHGADTHPKACLRRLAGGYKETSDGPTLLEKIGIAAVRTACPHFDGWLNRLEALGEETA
ncbi:MAG: DUF4276 family protein [Candidatus Accumulibacter sp.]|jgi:hypothetical protein|nr:DUF4276 family protein [Accumulibacter sp.]